jgi:hypothetical protein
MTFPQPRTAAALLACKDQFRLTTQLQSPGDIYEIESSTMALALGPDSDLGALQVFYYDSEMATSRLSSFRLTPQCPFIGKISPNLSQDYPLSGRLGRTLVSALDVYDPNYKPLGFSNANDKIQFEVPVLDLIGWFTNPPSAVPTKRADKSYFSQYQPHATANSWIIYPYYDRKYAFVDFLNRNTTDGATVTIRGVNFSTTDSGAGGVSYHQESTIVSAQAVAAAGGHMTRIITASSDGMFDALAIAVAGGEPNSLRVYMSDEPISGYVAVPLRVTP